MIALHRYLSAGLIVLAFVVIVFGAYVRLTDAGLGCPDWPGCYGHVGVPETAEAIASANERWSRPVETGKAWREMIHRYLASTLGFGILVLAALASLVPRDARLPRVIPLLLVPLVLFQGLLGMWTVSLLLVPLVVVLHLVGGLTILTLLWLNWLKLQRPAPAPASTRPRRSTLTAIALAALTVQIVLGGWTSTNYAALACTDFPTCHGTYWPEMDFATGFTFWHGLGIDYEYGILDTPSRTAVHFTHRLWAMVAAALIAAAAVTALNNTGRRLAWCIITLLCVQVGLGISNVWFGLPLTVAVAHNGVAALLLLSLVTLLYRQRWQPNGR